MTRFKDADFFTSMDAPAQHEYNCLMNMAAALDKAAEGGMPVHREKEC